MLGRMEASKSREASKCKWPVRAARPVRANDASKSRMASKSNASKSRMASKSNASKSRKASKSKIVEAWSLWISRNSKNQKGVTHILACYGSCFVVMIPTASLKYVAKVLELWMRSNVVGT